MNENDDAGMGTPILSLDGFLELDVPLPERVLAEIHARNELRRALAEDEEYWARLGSGCMLDEAGDLSHVKEEFRAYARHWVQHGNDLNVISDFAAHQALREERFNRREEAKARRARATEAKLAAISASNNYQEAQANRQRQQSAKRAAEDASMFAEVPPPTLSVDPNAALTVLENVEQKLRSIEDGICQEVPELEGADRKVCIEAYDHMIRWFETSVAMKRKYGFTRADLTAAPLKAGAPVPSYFANVADGSIFRRKVLSMAGLRNLIIYGPTIYCSLRDLKFSGNLADHPEDAGLKLMRQVTGNVVDLDTTVLRCTDAATLNAINALNKHKGQPTHRNTDDFANSTQAREIAVNCALPVLDDFAKAMHLTTKAQRQARNIDAESINPVAIPVATNNTDRGKHPVWQYVNAGQNSFHANVPTMADVNGALLKAPFHCLRCWLVIFALHGHNDKELADHVDDFFEHCVVDSCFNGKWKSIEEYVSKMKHEGTIVDVLQRTQQRHQDIFTIDFFDADNDDQANEIAEMTRLTRGLVGRSAKTGEMRSVTEEDVKRWVLDPSVII